MSLHYSSPQAQKFFNFFHSRISPGAEGLLARFLRQPGRALASTPSGRRRRYARAAPHALTRGLDDGLYEGYLLPSQRYEHQTVTSSARHLVCLRAISCDFVTISCAFV